MPDSTIAVVNTQLDDLKTLVENRTQSLLASAEASLSRGGGDAITTINTARTELEGASDSLTNQIRATLYGLQAGFESELAKGVEPIILLMELLNQGVTNVTHLVQLEFGAWRQTMDVAVDSAIANITDAHALTLAYIESINRIINKEVSTSLDIAKDQMAAIVNELKQALSDAVVHYEEEVYNLNQTVQDEATGLLDIVFRGISFLGNPLDFLFKTFLDMLTDMADLSPEALKSSIQTVMGFARDFTMETVPGMTAEVES